MSQHLPILMVLLPLLGSIFYSLLHCTNLRKTQFLTPFILGLSTLASALCWQKVLAEGPLHYPLGGWLAPWGIEYVLDRLSASLSFLVLSISFLVSLYARRSFQGLLPALYMLLTTSLTGMIVTGDLFNFYVFLEISALSAYGLLASGGNRATFAVFRYLLVATIGASFFLLGLGFLYASTGTLNMYDMASILSQIPLNRAITLGVALMITGLAIKTAVFPLHGWLPDVYSYGPTPIVAFVAAVMTKISAYGIFRILYFVFQAGGATTEIMNYLGIFAALGILLGSILAVAQNDVRRMLAYSSISQLGYIILGFSIGTWTAVLGSLFHVFNHAVMKACLFLGTNAIHTQTGIKYVSSYKGVAQRLPWTSICFVVAGISMIGLPPTGGFFSKWYLLKGGIETQAWLYVATILIGSLITAIYFFRLFEFMYLQKPTSQTSNAKKELPWSMIFPMAALALSILFLGFCNQTVIRGISPQNPIVSDRR